MQHRSTRQHLLQLLKCLPRPRLLPQLLRNHFRVSQCLQRCRQRRIQRNIIPQKINKTQKRLHSLPRLRCLHLLKHFCFERINSPPLPIHNHPHKLNSFIQNLALSWLQSKVSIIQLLNHLNHILHMTLNIL